MTKVLPVQSLHLLPVLGSLARDWHDLKNKARAFPEFEQIHHVVSKHGAQLNTRNPVLYPTELRRHARYFYVMLAILTSTHVF